MGKQFATIERENFAKMRIHKKMEAYNSFHMELLLDYLAKWWLDRLDHHLDLIKTIALGKNSRLAPLISFYMICSLDAGLLWKTGVLQALRFSPITSKEGALQTCLLSP